MVKIRSDLTRSRYKIGVCLLAGTINFNFNVPSDTFSKTVTGGLETVAFRMPDNQATLALIEQTNVPLVGPSANTSGKPSPTSAEHVYHDLRGKLLPY